MREHPPSTGRAGRLVAWLGGAAFVASLGYFVYAYAVRFGQAASLPVTSDLTNPVIINLALFTAFAAHHSVMARAGAKQWIARYLPPVFERSVYVWIGSMLFFLTCLWWREVP